MTVKKLFENLLTELSKTKAPAMLLSDFNYFVNKAINQYVNKQYNLCDINQQLVDNLRVLKSNALLTPEKITQFTGIDFSNSSLFSGYYETSLPDDYVHLLNCICIYQIKNKNYKCHKVGDWVQFPATRLTSDKWPEVSSNYYLRPLPERPYYFISNTNTQTDTPTNPRVNGDKYGTDLYYTKNEDWGTDAFSRKLQLKVNSNQREANSVEREAGIRYGNASKVRLELRCGPDDIFELKHIQVDYIKAPQHVRLTQEEINQVQDTSQVLEFPDYVCQEILNELVMLAMENTADPRINTNPIVSRSIASPTQQQTINQPRQG